MTALPPSPGDRGLSLIELVIAMALFALVAVMGTQALTGMLRMRDGLDTRATEAQRLDRAVSLLRADLDALVPMLFYPPERQAPRSALRWRQDRLGLSVGGQTDLPHSPVASAVPTRLAVQRIDWRLQNGQLTRATWPTLFPAEARSRSPDVPVLQGVLQLQLRSYWPDLGWINGTSPLQLGNTPEGADSDTAAIATEVYSSALPLAVELTLETRAFGVITLVETLK